MTEFVIPFLNVSYANKLLPDSIAGQMQALKTGQAPPSKPRRKQRQESSDDESDTDEEEDDTSATNTDTEDES